MLAAKLRKVREKVGSFSVKISVPETMRTQVISIRIPKSPPTKPNAQTQFPGIATATKQRTPITTLKSSLISPPITAYQGTITRVYVFAEKISRKFLAQPKKSFVTQT